MKTPLLSHIYLLLNLTFSSLRIFSMDQILQTFARLGEGDRESTMKSLSTMMRDRNHRPPAKKKVNGFIGYRAYYSALFSQLPQKERSPFMTMLWQQDTFHNEWDFMCAVYSTIRTFLEESKISLQIWIKFAVSHLGIIPRESYMSALGWHLMQLEDGSHELMRTATSEVYQYPLQPMNGLGLFKQCVASGLPVTSPQAIIAKLSDPTYDVICMNTRLPNISTGSDLSVNSRNTFKNRPDLAMGALFPVVFTDQLHGHAGRCSKHATASLSEEFQQEVLNTGPLFELSNPPVDTMLGAMLHDGIMGHEGDGTIGNAGFFDVAIGVDGSISELSHGSSFLDGFETSFYHSYS
ncbi:mating-type protein MAT alpha 1-domain-containing protein [Podospora appendiculata]|uniref:Mating-type protein MAT alpha 1-domain-containing protein n=1 Tax=Podospora appendiculata TaxID=314037 RepID=A0AAE0XLF5_9PEZI|nr:mating-type protein MAT alpha 1-domain-containing protein [Podospora appendiculata]